MDIITRNELKERGGIYIEQVLSAFNQYESCTWTFSLDKYTDMFVNLQNHHILYVDFYYSKITEENRVVFETHLNKDKMELLDQLCAKCRGNGNLEYVIFKPSREELGLLVEISFRELLFSTFYILDLPLTIWSNYGGEFAGFAKEKELLGGITCNY
ncbi:MAG: hypothetical protein Q4G58_00325 [bacterium]|nr:hypothetical protein [bacterium]